MRWSDDDTGIRCPDGEPCGKPDLGRRIDPRGAEGRRIAASLGAAPSPPPLAEVVASMRGVLRDRRRQMPRLASDAGVDRRDAKDALDELVRRGEARHSYQSHHHYYWRPPPATEPERSFITLRPGSAVVVPRDSILIIRADTNDVTTNTLAFYLHEQGVEAVILPSHFECTVMNSRKADVPEC